MMTTLAKGGLRLRCSSSDGVLKQPTARFLNGNKLQVTAADFVCVLAAGAVTLTTNGRPTEAVVAANSFGVDGVWIQIASGSDFWIELYFEDGNGSALKRAEAP